MIIPKKSLSQNFLIDKNIAKKIINLTDIQNKVIIEIGPGQGILTREILYLKPKKLILIEKDEVLFNLLKKEFQSHLNVEIINIDVLDYDFEKVNKCNVISNLPYNISVKIITKLLYFPHKFSNLILMIQKEVAYKMNNKKNLKNNKLQYFKIKS